MLLFFMNICYHYNYRGQWSSTYILCRATEPAHGGAAHGGAAGGGAAGGGAAGGGAAHGGENKMMR